MQRISFKHVVFLALLVMSMSLVPSTIVHSEPEDGIIFRPENQGAEATYLAPNPGIQTGGGSDGNDSEGADTKQNLEKLQREINELKRKLETKVYSDTDDQPWFRNLEMIIGIMALSVSALSAVLFWVLFNSLDKSLKRIKGSLKELKSVLDRVEMDKEMLATQVKADVQSVQKKQDFFEASSVLKSQSLPFQAPPSSSPVVNDVPENPPPSVTVASLIRAINTGDRQVLREATTAELNITSSSENNIVMGMSEATELEEVSAGGSYLLVSLEGRALLFPTDRTLRGFSTTQPNKGLYNYEQQSVAKAEIIEPAVLEKSGGVWRVIQKGIVAFP